MMLGYAKAIFNILLDIKNTPLDNHIQRGETVQLYSKRYDFISNL